MHERTTLRRLGVIVSAGLVTVGLTAFPAYTLADDGGNGNGNGNGGNGNGGNGNGGNGNGNGGNGNGNGGNGNGNGNRNGDADANGNANGNGVEQVVICHVPPGNPGNEHTIIVGEPAVDAHVDNHDDTVGPCDVATSTSTTSTSTSTTSTSLTVPPVGVEQVVICHVPPGNPGNEHTIIVGEPAVDAHVDNHDDTVGPCDVTTSTSTTSTSTSTTSTSLAVAPVALPDILLQDATVGQPFSLNVLANDDLGNPVAMITADTFDPTLQSGCIGLSFEPATGVIAGTPTQGGTCPFAYVIQNAAGFSLTQVLVPVLD